MKKIKILFVCHGNICRSPMAEAIMKKMISDEGLQDVFEISSAATSREELGNNIHPLAYRELQKHSIMQFSHTARQFNMDDYRHFDYIYVMDNNNMQNILRIIKNDQDEKIKMLCDMQIDDPWYTGDFQTTYKQIEAGCKKILEQFK